MPVRRMLVGLAMIVATAIGAAAPPAIAETIHLEADLQKSQISATVGEPLAVVRDQATATGAFRMNSCEIDGDPNNLAATAHVKLVIDATTYDSGSTTRDRNVIHSALETAKYQTIDFESTALEDVQIDVPGVSGSATVVGKLTLHGTTKIMRVPVRVSMSTDGEFSAGGEVQFRYTDFGIKAPRLVFLLPASDMTTVTFRILAQRPAAAAPPPQTRRQPIDDGRPQPRLASRQH